MPAMEPSEQPATKKPGRLTTALLRLLMKRATITANERLTDGFHMLTLEGKALEGVTWIPGQKMQVAMGSAFVARTYTPLDWNADTGRVRILGFTHGEGPGSAWVRNARPGDECDLFGPRTSTDVRATAGPFAIFGDETSIGLAYALSNQDRARTCTCHFEVADIQRTREVAAHLDLTSAALFARQDDDEHIEVMRAALPALVADGATFVLTGKANTIQRLRQSLKQWDVSSERIRSKAYWTPGKTGLD